MSFFKKQVIDIKNINADRLVWLVMWMTTLGQAAISLYLPAFPQIAAQLGFAESILKLSITVFLIGFGASQLIYGPLSDQFGRKPILLIGIAIFSWACLMSLLSHNPLGFLFFRFLQGLGCGATITLGRSILRDCFTGKKLASAASALSMGFAISFGISPVIGAYLQSFFSWKADFIFLAAVGLFLLILFWRFLPETNPSIKYKSSQKFSMKLLIKEYSQIVRNKTFLKFLSGGVCAYGVVIAYNVMTPFLIQNVLGYSANFYGWSTLAVAFAYFGGAVFNRQMSLKFDKNVLFISGSLLILFSGLVLLILSLFLKLDLLMILIPVMVATFGQSMIFSNTIASALQAAPFELSSRASAMFSGLQLLLVGLLSSLFGLAPNTSLALGIVLLGLGVICCSLLCRRRDRVVE